MRGKRGGAKKNLKRNKPHNKGEEIIKIDMKGDTKVIPPTKDGIYNLSKYQMTEDDLSLLKKGLKFAPKNNFNSFNTFVNLQKKIRKLTIKKFFHKKEKGEAPLKEMEKSPLKLGSFKKLSTFYSVQSKGNFIETYGRMVSDEIRKIEGNKNKNKKFNLTKQENKALKNLQENKDIVIKPADKRGGLVIMDTSQYENEIIRQLTDGKTYSKLKRNPTEKIKNKLKELIEKYNIKGIITDEEKDFLIIQKQSTPIIYVPKIHKEPKNPPGRPIISGVNSITSNLSQSIDFYLQPLIIKTRSYL